MREDHQKKTEKKLQLHVALYTFMVIVGHRKVMRHSLLIGQTKITKNPI